MVPRLASSSPPVWSWPDGEPAPDKLPVAIAAAVATVDAAGQSLLVSSDGFPFEPEVALKRAAHEAGALVMGPDCGTAIVSGLALGFANVIRARPVGLVAVSGTGASRSPACWT